MSNTGNTSWVEHVTNVEVFTEDMTNQSSVEDSFTGDWLHGYLVREGGSTVDLMVGLLYESIHPT